MRRQAYCRDKGTCRIACLVPVCLNFDGVIRLLRPLPFLTSEVGVSLQHPRCGPPTSAEGHVPHGMHLRIIAKACSGHDGCSRLTLVPQTVLAASLTNLPCVHLAYYIITHQYSIKPFQPWNSSRSTRAHATVADDAHATSLLMSDQEWEWVPNSRKNIQLT